MDKLNTSRRRSQVISGGSAASVLLDMSALVLSMSGILVLAVVSPISSLGLVPGGPVGARCSMVHLDQNGL